MSHVDDEFDGRILDARNHGSQTLAKMLLEIAKTGIHNGTFGGADEEAVAQEIIKIREASFRKTVKLKRISEIIWETE